MTIKELVNSIADDVVERAQLNLGATRTINGKKRRRVASGRLKDGLSYKNLTRYNMPVVQFGVKDNELKKYADVIEFGRRKGARQPPSDAILEWMRIKPIRIRDKDGGFIKATEAKKRQVAYLIARSIGENGIDGIYYYREAIRDVLEKRGDEFFEAVNKEIEIRLNLS